MIKLCHIDEISDPGSKGLQIPTSTGDYHLFLVRQHNQIFAYKDECPHRGISLEWQEDEYLDESQQQIICSTHGALFEINTGRCTYGPCVNQSLQSLDIVIDKRIVYLISPI